MALQHGQGNNAAGAGLREIAITLDVYSHVTPTMGRDAAEQVAALIFGAGCTEL